MTGPPKKYLVGGWTTHLKNMSQNGFIFPKFGVKIKKKWNHRLDTESKHRSLTWVSVFAWMSLGDF